MVMILILKPVFISLSLFISFNFTFLGKINTLMIWLMILIYFLSKPVQISKESICVTLTLCFILFLFFSTNNMFWFYITFEISLIPIFVLIFGYGYQPERIQASIYLIIYTLSCSMPLLMLLIFIFYFKIFSFKSVLNFYFSFLFLMMLIMAFLAKTPAFILHFWLPKAHVEASTIGSIFLASLLLKLGTFSLVKMFFLIKNFYCPPQFFIVGILLVPVLVLFQSDGKSIIAYSSIIHMNFLLIILIIMNTYSMYSINIMMLSHGAISGTLFFLFGLLFYSTMTRKIYLIKSMTPSLLWGTIILFLLMNFGFPPFLSFVSEMLFIIILFMKTNFFFIFLVIFSLLSSYFVVFLMSAWSFGYKEIKMNHQQSMIYPALIFMMMMLAVNLVNIF